MKDNLDTYSVFCILLYVFAWILTLLYKRRNHTIWGASGILYWSYTFYAILGLLLFCISDLYTKPLTLFPLIYLYIMFRIASRPIEQYDRNRVIGIKPPKNLQLINYFVVFYIVIAFFQIPSIIENLTNGITMIMLDSENAHSIYSETKANAESSDGSVSNLIAIIYYAYSPLLYFLLFYCLSQRKHIFFIISLIICIIIELFSGLSRGQRTGTTMMLLSFVISYFAFRNCLTEKLKSKIKKIGLVAGFIVITPFLILTISRFGDTDAAGSIMDYAGQCTLNFDYYGLSANGVRNGDRTCNTFKKLLHISGTPKGVEETRSKYSYMYLDDSLFSTFVGDFTLDFGPIIAMLLFIFFSFLITRLTSFHGNVIPFHKAILCYLVMLICMQGGMYLFTFSYSANISLLAIVIFYIIFYLDYKSIRVSHV